MRSRLAEANVDLTVYGHVHSYYAFSNAGMPAFITGGGGAIPERFDAIGRHYLVVDADPIRNVFDVARVRVGGPPDQGTCVAAGDRPQRKDGHECGTTIG